VGAVAAVRFVLSESLVASLRAVQEQRGYSDEVTRQEDAFLLDPGMGPACYLAADGRVLIDGRDWDDTPLREATTDEAISKLVVGAQKTGVAELLSLLPLTPDGAALCPRCQGEHWATLTTASVRGGSVRMVCWECGGRGWVTGERRS
jgi:hypothetical protein